jgi:hypothetical protein
VRVLRLDEYNNRISDFLWGEKNGKRAWLEAGQAAAVRWPGRPDGRTDAGAGKPRPSPARDPGGQCPSPWRLAPGPRKLCPGGQSQAYFYNFSISIRHITGKFSQIYSICM